MVTGNQFFTDSIDGFLARKYKVTSKFGTRLDSIGDDLTVFAATLGLFVVHPVFYPFTSYSAGSIICTVSGANGLCFLDVWQAFGFSCLYGQTGGHIAGYIPCAGFLFTTTYCVVVLCGDWNYSTATKEEIMLVRMLPQWRGNVKGLWWVCREQRKLNK
ncbi:MAG: CDP-alcohol phosphatidyltransferase family protein [Chitinophagaceae bacterium]|nr:CDP-alcohol phosphatidyltransferase family protein [Chitinophagaceae bacterium]